MQHLFDPMNLTLPNSKKHLAGRPSAPPPRSLHPLFGHNQHFLFFIKKSQIAETRRSFLQETTGTPIESNAIEDTSSNVAETKNRVRTVDKQKSAPNSFQKTPRSGKCPFYLASGQHLHLRRAGAGTANPNFYIPFGNKKDRKFLLR